MFPTNTGAQIHTLHTHGTSVFDKNSMKYIPFLIKIKDFKPIAILCMLYTFPRRLSWVSGVPRGVSWVSMVPRRVSRVSVVLNN